MDFVSSGSYSYPCISPRREQQFDQCDLLEEELEAAQSKASNKDTVTFFRLGNGRASRSKAVSDNQLVSVSCFLSVPLELIVLNAQAELLWV